MIKKNPDSVNPEFGFDTMKNPVLKQKEIALTGILIILGIISCFITHGIFFPGIHHTSGNFSLNETNPVQEQKVIDVIFEIQEWSENYPRWMTVVHLTSDDLNDFPDVEQVIHGAKTDPGAWQNDHRVVAWFEGNESDYIRFHTAACKNKTLAECYPNTPIYEYNGQYYTISYQEIGFHTLPGCEKGNYNCT